jgi:hypothetical protein
MFHEIEKHWPHTSLHTCTKTVHTIIPNIVNTDGYVHKERNRFYHLLLQVGDAKKVFKSNTEAHDTKPQQNWPRGKRRLTSRTRACPWASSTRIATRNQCLPLTPPCSHPPTLPRKSGSKKQKSNNHPWMITTKQTLEIESSVGGSSRSGFGFHGGNL